MFRLLEGLKGEKTVEFTAIQLKLATMPENWVVLFLVDPEKYTRFNLELLRLLAHDLQLPGIYITINKPYTHLITTLQREGIPLDRLIFIDAISRSIGQAKDRGRHCLYVAGPDNLIDIGIGLTEAVGRFRGQATPFVFLDSLSTLLLHNTTAAVGKFSHFTISKIRAWNVRGVVMSLEQDITSDVMRTITQYCDEILRVE